MKLLRFLPDKLILMMLGAVALAALLPVGGKAAEVFSWVTDLAIGLLFFMHGAKLSTKAVFEGLTHWRLHLLIFSFTFVLFPVLGLALKPVLVPMVGDDLYLGILYLCALPATVQSAIALTSVAGGNIPAAVCSAATSSLIGIFLTPFIVMLIMGTAAASIDPAEAIQGIVIQLLLPFIAGQIARIWIGNWVAANKQWLKYLDQSSILLVVYGAFSHAVNEGLWSRLPIMDLIGLVVACLLLLALVLLLTNIAGKAFGFPLEDRITIVFAASKKSLATGVPMAQVLFAGAASMGTLILPLMLFHQIQLMVCAVLANKYARLPREAELIAQS
ncbi:MAG: bile acid:sodium symporter [Oceanospirillaceae bacterium]|uniref:bile acid:sodium symporter family protein n=1 Tax=unclassified Thalassolituus TaxID=2624967 RepID=UPI000C4D8180|nr:MULTISPECIES: bile acid:sodium symporter family protein [unclassified Thalassolituus]MAS24826.1 bile acid:sodium symporter [Oceanospirillaceae bacterium]MBS53224.1 bile acid:sodium symporter [Oceanospirillaceae bacterium]|tara:strand:+ start:174 stop:1166 length:993 start_codon:yes stop_codon:yes gene_type:complete